MKEGAKNVPEAAYFLGSGCEPLRSGLGISGLLLPQVLSSHMVNAVGNGSPAIDLGNEIIWDDYDADDRKLSAAAFMNTMSVMKVRQVAGEGEGCGVVKQGPAARGWRGITRRGMRGVQLLVGWRAVQPCT
jgi:hypothetical protein